MAACTSLLTAKNPSSKLVRWAMSVQELDLDIRHRSGKSNQVAEVLSRNPIAVSQVLLFQSVTAGGSGPGNTTTTTSETDLPAGAPDSDVGHLQRQDPQLSPWFAYLEDGPLLTDSQTGRRLVLEQDNFQLMDGVLYHVNPSAPELWRLAIPECLRTALMKEHHSGKFAGHFAERKLHATLSRQYWWKGMRADVRRFCRSCLVCASRKGTGRKTRPPLKSIPVGGPFEMIGVDVLQLPLSYGRNQYAVVFQDYLTKWPEVFAVADQKADTIAHLLVEHVVARHGVPQRLLSDRGSNFLSLLVQEVCKLLGTTKVNTSGYHPQCDGLVEKFNNILINMISKSVDKYGRDWDVHLPYLVFAYRVAVQESTGASPFYLLYGREPVLPTSEALTHPRSAYQLDFHDYGAELVAHLSDAWALARDNIKAAQTKQKRQYDHKSSVSKLKVNDGVMVHFPSAAQGKAWKLARPYFGPYQIISLTPNNAEVQLVDQPDGETLFVALDRVRPCYSEMSNDVWVGHGRQATKARRKKTTQNVESTLPSTGYCGPRTRSRSRKEN